MPNKLGLTDKGLLTIMKSANFGILKADGESVAKSPKFAGLARMKSENNPALQYKNKLARLNFADALIKEFKLSPIDQESLKERLTKRSSPISIRDAKIIIKAFAHGRDMRDDIEKSPLNIRTFSDKELRATLSDPSFFSKSIERSVLAELGSQIKTILSKGGSLQDVQNHVRDWAREEGRDDSPDALDKLITDLGFKTVKQERTEALAKDLNLLKEKGAGPTDIFNHVKDWLKQQDQHSDDMSVKRLMNRLGHHTERDILVNDLREKVKNWISEDALKPEIIENATRFAKEHNLDTSDFAVRGLLREADYRV